MESIVDVEPIAALPITSDLVERLVDEFQTLKNAMNVVELQLYEANEKIAELLENVNVPFSKSVKCIRVKFKILAATPHGGGKRNVAYGEHKSDQSRQTVNGKYEGER